MRKGKDNINLAARRNKCLVPIDERRNSKRARVWTESILIFGENQIELGKTNSVKNLSVLPSRVYDNHVILYTLNCQF